MFKPERELLSRLDQIHKRQHPNQLQLDARIASYELAAKLQMEATEALDINKESKETLEMYGVGQEPTDSYARRCIMARRLVERGVRFVQLYINGQIWDNHSYLQRDMKAACARTDKPVAALLKDLKQRGLHEGHAGHLGRRVRPNADRSNSTMDSKAPDAITILTPSHYGWPGRVSSLALTSERPMSSATRPSKIGSALPIGMRPFCICSGSIISGSSSTRTV